MAKAKKNQVTHQTETTSIPYIGTVAVDSFNFDVGMHTRLYAYLHGIIKNDYHVRKHVIGFRFHDGTIVKMRARTALINVILWKPYCNYKKLITKETLFDTKKISEDTIAEKLDEIISIFRYEADIDDLCKTIRYIIQPLALIPKDFCHIIGNTMSKRDIIELAQRNPKFNDIIHTKFPDSMSIPEIESEINVRVNAAVDIINNDKETNLHPFLKAGGNVNIGQLSQCIVSIGPRSDMAGNIAPVIVNTNFVMGLKTPIDYYLESFSCRKALIANRYQMSDSGYTSRQIDLLCIDAGLVDTQDCFTDHHVEVAVTSEKMLNMLEYKLMYTGERNIDGSPKYHEINPREDRHLIKKSILIRSPILCALEEGKICRTCYGEMQYFVSGYHSSLIASHALTKPLSQAVLSTKHLIKTRTKEVIWPDLMKGYFDCQPESIYIKSDMLKSMSEIGFYLEDIEEYLNTFDAAVDSDDEDDETTSDPLLDYVNRLVVVVDHQIIPIDNGDIEMYINSDIIGKLLRSNKIDDGIIYISTTGMSVDTPIFDMNIENMEIGVFLKRIMSLLGIKSKSVYTTIDDLVNRLANAIIEVGVKINFVHLESIIYSMIHDPNMIIHRPDFAGKEVPEYSILPTCNAIMNSRALTTSLGFERIPYQLGNVFTYYKKSDGFLDPFFK